MPLANAIANAIPFIPVSDTGAGFIPGGNKEFQNGDNAEFQNGDNYEYN